MTADPGRGVVAAPMVPFPKLPSRAVPLPPIPPERAVPLPLITPLPLADDAMSSSASCELKTASVNWRRWMNVSAQSLSKRRGRESQIHAATTPSKRVAKLAGLGDGTVAIGVPGDVLLWSDENNVSGLR